MDIQLVLCLIIGFLSYWAFKAPSTIVGDNPINTYAAFFNKNLREIFLSILGLAFVLVAGDQIPEDLGKINGPLPAFILGGSIPSIFMNTVGLFTSLKLFNK